MNIEQVLLESNKELREESDRLNTDNYRLKLYNTHLQGRVEGMEEDAETSGQHVKDLKEEIRELLKENKDLQDENCQLVCDLGTLRETHDKLKQSSVSPQDCVPMTAYNTVMESWNKLKDTYTELKLHHDESLKFFDEKFAEWAKDMEHYKDIVQRRDQRILQLKREAGEDRETEREYERATEEAYSLINKAWDQINVANNLTKTVRQKEFSAAGNLRSAMKVLKN